MKDFLWIVAGLAAFTLLLVSIGLSADDNTWEQTEDPNCYLHVYKNNQLFGADTVTRERYCK